MSAALACADGVAFEHLDADELDALRADREALQQALQQAARREAEMERQLTACAVPADGQRALPTVAVLAAIEGRLRKLQTAHHV